MYLVEVVDCDKAMRVQVSVETVVDAHQINNPGIFSNNEVDGSLLDKPRSAVLGQGLLCV